MTNSEALEILRKEHTCMERICDPLRVSCFDCEYKVKPVFLAQAIDTAIEALELCVMIEDDKK